VETILTMYVYASVWIPEKVNTINKTSEIG